MHRDVARLRSDRDVVLTLSDRNFPSCQTQGRESDRNENRHELTPGTVEAAPVEDENDWDQRCRWDAQRSRMVGIARMGARLRRSNKLNR